MSRMTLVLRALRPPRLLNWAGVLSFVGLGVVVCAMFVSQELRQETGPGAIGVAALARVLLPILIDFVLFGAFWGWLFWRPRLSSWLAAALTLAFLFMEAVQLQSRILSSEFITAEILTMVELLGYSIDGFAIVGLLGLLAATAGLLWLGTGRWKLKEVSLADRFRVTACTLVLTGLVAAVPLSSAQEMKRLAQQLGVQADSPALRMAGAFAELAQAMLGSDLQPPSAAQLEEAHSFGLQLAPGQSLPLRKETIYSKPLPFAKTQELQTPNLIILFVESLSAELVGAYGNGLLDITPNVDQFAKQAMRVDNYVNHTYPTSIGLRGQLCSNYPGFTHTQWIKSQKKLGAVQLLCLPHLLKPRGYESVYLTHGTASHVSTKEQFLDFGFDTFYFGNEVRRLLGKSARKGELHDRRMFAALRVVLERRDSEKPFFLAFSNIQTHVGHNAPKKYAYADRKNPVLNTTHHFDYAFGRFWRWFMASKFMHNTMVVLTADHAIPPNRYVRQIRHPKYMNGRVGHVALIVYDPTHDLPHVYDARTSSVDLIPTLAQLMNVPNRANPFAGVSMFTDREHRQGGLAIGQADYAYWDNGEPKLKLRKDCTKDLHSCPGFAALLYAQGLDAANQIWSAPGKP